MSEKPITEVLEQVRRGEPGASERLFSLVYGELKALARRQLRGEGNGRTLTPTALVHELYVKVVGAGAVANDREHFFALSARAMRQLLVDHARRKSAARRGGGAIVDELDADFALEGPDVEDVLSVDQALEKLEALDARLAKVVEYRFFAGLTEEEIAEVLQVTVRTVRRDWRKARAFVFRELQPPQS